MVWILPRADFVNYILCEVCLWTGERQKISAVYFDVHSIGECKKEYTKKRKIKYK